ncbi:MAG: hypothetical protein KC503_41970 [Myxococcales bacterium]|nr:hypothetical protein [Myxococcales bacterium]
MARSSSVAALLIAASLVVVVGACGDSTPTADSTVDVRRDGNDGSVDAPTDSTADAPSPDAPVDAPPSSEGGADAPIDAPPSEASVDAAIDAPPADASVDTTSPDATVDTTSPDATVDTTSPDTTVDTTSPDATVDTTSPDTTVDTTSPDATVDTTSPDATADSSVDVGVTRFSTVYSTVISPNCSCHISGASGGLSMATEQTAYNNLVGVASNCSGALRVSAGSSANSLIWNKVEGSGPVFCGDRMPFGGAQLPQNLRDLIRDWIDDGALQ